MARFLTESLQLRHTLRRSLTHYSSLHRPFSTRPGQLFEIEINPSATAASSTSDGESVAGMLKTLDDIVQRILVQKATPDWLPFVPGSSFWVPPRHTPLGVSDFVGKLADRLSDEETLSVATDRGWPCSRFLINESDSVERRAVDQETEEVEMVEVEVKVLATNNEEE